MYTNKHKLFLIVFNLFIFIENVSCLNSQNEKPDETSSTVFKTTDKPRTSRLKSQKSYMSNPSLLLDITDGGFPDVTYPTSIIDREQFYFGSGGFDDVLRPFSDDVRNSYKALKTDNKVTYSKPLEEINVVNKKKPLSNQTVSQIFNNDSLNTVKSYNSCHETEKVTNDFNITKDDVTETNTDFCLNSIEENELNTTTCIENVVEDSILLFLNKSQLDICTELENKIEPGNIDLELNRETTAETYLTDGKEKQDEITYRNSIKESDLGDSDFFIKLNNTRNIFDSILNGIEKLQPLKKKPSDEDTMKDIMPKDYQTSQDNQSRIQVIYDKDPIRNEEIRTMSDDSNESMEGLKRNWSNFNSDVVSKISDGVPKALMLGQANDNVLDSSTEMFKKEILALFNKDNNEQLESHDFTGAWLVDPEDLTAGQSNVLYKIYLVGPVSMLESIELEDDNSNEINVKSSANSISIFDGFKSARKPFSVLFNFSSSDS